MSLTYNFQIIAIKNTTYPHCAQFILWKVWISRKKYCPDGVIIHSIGLSCICSLVDKTLPAGRNFTIFGKYIQKRTLTIRSVFTMSYKLFLVPILAVVLLLCSVLWQDQRGPDGTLAPPPPAPHEAAPITVRIGYLRPDPSVASSLDVRHFYGQHLTELAKYLDWTYELVEVPPQEGLNRLRQGDIDLLLPMEPNPARQEELSYTKHNFFLDTIALYTREGEKHYHPRDLSNLDGVSVGLYENRPINQNFQKFCHDNKLTLQTHIYASQEDMLKALHSREINLVVDSTTNFMGEETFLLAFDLIPTNIAALKENQHLLDDLDRADDQLRQDDPEYVQQIHERFRTYLRPLITTYTPEESTYIRRSAPLKVAFFSSLPPYVEHTTALDKVQGIYPDLFRLLSNTSGFSFEFNHYANYEDAAEALKEGKADLIIDTYSAHTQNYSQFAYSNPLFAQEMTFIGPTSEDFSKLTTEPHRLAMVTRQSPSGLVYLQNELIGWSFCQYDDMHDCLEAVRRGDADYALIDTMQLQAERALLMYPTLTAVPTVSMKIPVCIVISKNLPPVLKTVLNKSILRISTEQVDRLVRSRGLDTHPSISTAYLFSHYPLQSGFAVGVFLLLLTTLIFSIHHNRQVIRQRKALTQTNHELGETLQELREAQKSRDAYKEQAETDALTGVLNKAAMEAFVKKNLSLLKPDQPVSDAFIIADLDHFKEANDTQGHQYGDDILKDFAHALIRLTRHRDGVGRFGGDEFVLYLRNIPENALHAFAQRLLNAAHELDPVQRPPLSASIGIALINSADLTYDEIFSRADKALYAVKEGGRNGYRIYGE